MNFCFFYSNLFYSSLFFCKGPFLFCFFRPPQLKLLQWSFKLLFTLPKVFLVIVGVFFSSFKLNHLCNPGNNCFFSAWESVESIQEQISINYNSNNDNNNIHWSIRDVGKIRDATPTKLCVQKFSTLFIRKLDSSAEFLKNCFCFL